MVDLQCPPIEEVSASSPAMYSAGAQARSDAQLTNYFPGLWYEMSGGATKDSTKRTFRFIDGRVYSIQELSKSNLRIVIHPHVSTLFLCIGIVRIPSCALWKHHTILKP